MGFYSFSPSQYSLLDPPTLLVGSIDIKEIKLKKKNIQVKDKIYMSDS